jgi:methionyl aminopeptidase
MIHLKTSEEIEIMRESGRILRKTVDELIPWIKPGLSTKEVDDKAEELILKFGGKPSFKTVKGYHWTTCLPVNEQAVHTPPSAKRILKDGDILTVDIGVVYKGYHTDYADSILIGKGHDQRTIRFLEVGKKTLDAAIKLVKNGEHIGTLAQYIQPQIEKNGYHILKDLTGHGIGKDLHEDPFVLNYVDRPIAKTYKMRPGFVFALEIIYSMGSEKIAYEPGNDWSIISSDRSLAACFEKTLAVTDEKVFILT